MTSRDGVKCYLYWIKTKEMQDIFTEGYVGISVHPRVRFTQHIYSAKKGVSYYNKELIKGLLEGSVTQEILMVGEVSYCLEIENRLRHKAGIGWNIAVGGMSVGLAVKHGLSKTKEKSIYYNLLTRAKEQNIPVSSEMLPENNGLELFVEWYRGSVPKGMVVSVLGNDHVSLETLKVVTRGESTSIHNDRFSPLDGKGSYTVSELGRLFGIKSNTITYRMRRGETLRQALRLDPKIAKERKPRKKSTGYKGRLSEEDISNLRKDVTAGIPLVYLAEKYGMDSSNLGRVAHRFGIEAPAATYPNLVGGYFEIAYLSKFSEHDYDLITEMLLRGVTKSEIARQFRVSPSSITNVCKRLKWEEFCEQQKRALG